MSKFFNFIIEMTHKGKDNKILAVKYYLKNKDNIRKWKAYTETNV